MLVCVFACCMQSCALTARLVQNVEVFYGGFMCWTPVFLNRCENIPHQSRDAVKKIYRNIVDLFSNKIKLAYMKLSMLHAVNVTQCAIYGRPGEC